MTEVRWDLIKKLNSQGDIAYQEFVKYLQLEFQKSVNAMLMTESDDLIRKKVIRAQTFREILGVLGQGT